jgi:glycosyltransferase involved in cell wall biosynthesis
MNIGLDAKRIFFNNSGLGNYGRRFYHALEKAPGDDRFYLFTPKPVPADNPYLQEVNHSNSFITGPEKPWLKMMGGAPWRSRLIHARLKKEQIGIFYGLSNEIPFGKSHSGIVSAVIIHDLIFLRYPQLYPKFDAFFYKVKTRYASEKADYIIAASEQTKKDIVDFYNVHEDRISVIYPCSDPIFYSGKSVDSSEFFSPKRRYIISIGAITPRKNLMKTVQAFKLVKEKYDLDLVVIGTAVGLGRDYMKSVMNFLEENKMSDRVHFLGNVPYKFVPDICKKAELMVYPSQFEGFGMPIVEGLFSKIPVITSKGGCFPEAGGDATIYINPDDPEEIAVWIGKLMDSESLRNELIGKGYKYAQRFRQENIENEIVNFHKAVKKQILAGL